MDERESEAWLGLIAVSQLLPVALDSQLQRDAHLTHFEFMVLTSLRFAPENTLQMSELAASTNATLPRLSHVCTRLATRGIIDRFPSPEDKRATNVRLTAEGRRQLIHAMPGHVDTARRLVIDALTPAQLESLAEITDAITARLTDGEHRSPVPR